MTIAGRLVRLYPASFRDRWGHAVATESAATGWRSWPNLAASIVDLWLHPAIWPAESRAQRRGRAAVLAAAVAAAVWYLAHLAQELDTPLHAGAARSAALSGCGGLTLVGLLLVAPRPRLTITAARTALHRLAGKLAVPVVLGAAVVAAAHRDPGLIAAPLRLVLLGCWWLALALAAIQGCRAVAGLGADVLAPPRAGRLRLGIWALAAAAVIAGSVILGFAVSGAELDPLAAAVGAGLLLLTWAFVGTLRDLRDVAATD
ncbi:hypothetical protein F0L68_27465 [Solihabitans fulvus]|uniref:Uncharacterized protein n=1 Tax=Solihabitans fulvus TaxID=1892852 RepID=A0A5B2WW24_9PSEU|nr:hypothetical protein [Solihabitans fulvus]KAA2255931.1 hypothetical protein F0L68_27465 [Solihabitans fulvus]